MKKNAVLYILLFFLIGVNGFFLYNYIGKPDMVKESRPRNPMDFIIEQLEFDSEQMQKIKLLNRAHHHKMMRIRDDEKELKDALFNSISNSAIDENYVDSITTLIGEKEKMRDMATYYHFKKIQEICNDKQKEIFKKIINEALHKAGRREHGPPPHRREDGRLPPPPPL